VAAPFVHRLRVRYGECDPQGIVFNANYLAYWDVALTELWREAIDGGYTHMTEQGIDLVVAEATQRFRAPAGFDDELAIGMTIERLGTTGITTGVTIDKDETRVVEGTVRHVVISLETGQKAPIPDWLRAALAPYAEPAAAA
jgi:acyl-CoA thioester hydrolase